MSTIIDLERVTAKTTLGRSTIYAYMKAGKFPAAIQVSARHVAWIEEEIDAWVQERIAASRPSQTETVAA